MYYIPFNLFPKQYQISGYINASIIKEFYLNYTSDVISTSNHSKIYIHSKSINFMLISDNSANLLFAT